MATKNGRNIVAAFMVILCAAGAIYIVIAQMRADAEKKRVEVEQQRIEAERRRVEAERQRAIVAARNALNQCDAQASHPSDPQRRGAPVPDERLALGAAIEECELAVKLNPGEARAFFQLGRVYWMARRDKEALALFVSSDERGYVASAKFIGDAFYENRGLPAAAKANAETALEWYRKAFAGGFIAASEAIAAAETAIRKNTFDASKFQYSSNMKALYVGDFDSVEAPVALAYYTQGIIKRLDDENTVFMDQKCKPLLNIIGNKVIDYADALAILKELAAAKGRSSDENFKRGARALFDVFIGADAYRDYGDRDATVLFDKDVYGCDSEVTKKVISNIMIRLKTKQ